MAGWNPRKFLENQGIRQQLSFTQTRATRERRSPEHPTGGEVDADFCLLGPSQASELHDKQIGIYYGQSLQARLTMTDAQYVMYADVEYLVPTQHISNAPS